MLKDEDSFFFGLATAPAHVEDRLNDAWLQFAEESPTENAAESFEDIQPADALLSSASPDGGSQPPSVTISEGSTSKKIKKPVKIAMEAMIRGFNKYSEETEDEPAPCVEHTHNVVAWHNVPRP